MNVNLDIRSNVRDRLFLTILILLPLASSPHSVSSEEILSKKPSHNLKITVEDIQYLGGSKYKMIIALMNLSRETLHIEINIPVISVQTNTIGTAGWIKAAVFDGSNPRFMLKAHEIINKSFIIHVPLERYENLYRTYEGDISLKVETEILFKRSSSNGSNRMDKMEEVYLWLRPETNKWIHREGM